MSKCSVIYIHIYIYYIEEITKQSCKTNKERSDRSDRNKAIIIINYINPSFHVLRKIWNTSWVLAGKPLRKICFYSGIKKNVLYLSVYGGRYMRLCSVSLRRQARSAMDNKVLMPCEHATSSREETKWWKMGEYQGNKHRKCDCYNTVRKLTGPTVK